MLVFFTILTLERLKIPRNFMSSLPRNFQDGWKTIPNPFGFQSVLGLFELLNFVLINKKTWIHQLLTDIHSFFLVLGSQVGFRNVLVFHIRVVMTHEFSFMNDQISS